MSLIVTITLPDEVANRAEAAGLRMDQVQRIAAAGGAGAVLAFIGETDRLDEEGGGALIGEPRIPEDLADALAEGAEDVRAGRLLTLEEADAGLPARIAAERARLQQEKVEALSAGERLAQFAAARPSTPGTEGR